MNLGLSESLGGLVRRKFAQARQSQDLIFSDTQLTVLLSRSVVPFQLRYCPALAKKPKSDDLKEGRQKTDKPKFDPFENPSDELLIARIPTENPSHVLVLNKFPVIENHFILATQTNKPQTGLLEPDDLGLSYACLRAWEQNQKEAGMDTQSSSLFAFFNSGEHSGASQSHRHLQFLPVADMARGSSEHWELLIDGMTATAHDDPLLMHNPNLPFIHFAMQLEPSTSAQRLHEMYVKLMNAARSTTSDSNDNQIVRDGQTTFSYNLAMTTSMLAILPRRTEASTMAGLSDSEVAINGTILAGTLMVKLQSEWDGLREKPELLDEVLMQVSFPVRSRKKSEPQRL